MPLAIRLTATAEAQIAALLDYYILYRRDEAILRLRAAVARALADIAANPARGMPFPGPYREIANWRYRWIKVHRYWFGYRDLGSEIVVTNVLFETSDLPRRVESDRTAG